MQKFNVTVQSCWPITVGQRVGTIDLATIANEEVSASRADVAVSKVLKTIGSTPVDPGTGNAYKAPVKLPVGKQLVITVMRTS